MVNMIKIEKCIGCEVRKECLYTIEPLEGGGEEPFCDDCYEEFMRDVLQERFN